MVSRRSVRRARKNAAKTRDTASAVWPLGYEGPSAASNGGRGRSNTYLSTITHAHPTPTVRTVASAASRRPRRTSAAAQTQSTARPVTDENPTVTIDTAAWTHPESSACNPAETASSRAESASAAVTTTPRTSEAASRARETAGHARIFGREQMLRVSTGTRRFCTFPRVGVGGGARGRTAHRGKSRKKAGGRGLSLRPIAVAGLVHAVVRTTVRVPPAGFEPAHPPPEGGALSPELRGRAREKSGVPFGRNDTSALPAGSENRRADGAPCGPAAPGAGGTAMRSGGGCGAAAARQ